MNCPLPPSLSHSPSPSLSLCLYCTYSHAHTRSQAFIISRTCSPEKRDVGHSGPSPCQPSRSPRCQEATSLSQHPCKCVSLSSRKMLPLHIGSFWPASLFLILSLLPFKTPSSLSTHRNQWVFFFLDKRNKSAPHIPAASSSLMAGS